MIEPSREGSPGHAQRPRASIIIPAFNQEEHIEACLEAIQAERPPSVEVLVVDDASTDRTAALATACGAEVIRAHRNGGPAAARNLGAEHACGEVLIFIDADVVLARGGLQRILLAFADQPTVAAMFGSYDTLPHAQTVVSDYRNLLHHFTHQAARSEATTFWSGCGAVRKAVFHAVGGFDQRPSINFIEDVELGFRLVRQGYRVLLDKDLQCTHLKRWTLASMVRTDVLYRARPWSILILSKRTLTSDLNLRWSQRLAVPLTVVGTVLLPAGLIWPHVLLASVLAVLAALALSYPFFHFLARVRGVPFALACAPLHLLHHLCSATGLLLACQQCGWSLQPTAGSTAPDPGPAVADGPEGHLGGPQVDRA